jgi:hypothetical protein
VSAFAAPFGLKPLYHPSGIIRPKALDIASGYGTAIFQYGPVALGAPAVGLIAGPQLASTGPIIGTFLGVEFTPNDGRRRYSNNWPAGQTYNAGSCVAYYTDDQLITYEIQANGSITEAEIGNQADFTAEVGNTTTGFSTIALDQTGLTTTGNKQLKIIGLTPGPLNAFGDAFTIVQVQIANHQFTATRAAF